MCATPSVVRRIVASYVGGTRVVVVVVVVVELVVLLSADVGRGIDSGPSPGEHAASNKAPTVITAPTTRTES
jgi:hypothetical protein